MKDQVFPGETVKTKTKWVYGWAPGVEPPDSTGTELPFLLSRLHGEIEGLCIAVLQVKDNHNLHHDLPYQVPYLVLYTKKMGLVWCWMGDHVHKQV